MVLLLIGALHALQIGHIGAPGVQTGTGAVDAGLGVVACTGRPHRVADAAVVGEDLVLDRLHRLADGFPRRGGDLVHRGVDEGVGRGAVLLLVLQIGVDGHRLCLPGLLGRAGADIAANGAQLRVGDAHQTVHKVQRHVAPQPLSLDVQIRHGDGITGAEQPAQTVFLLGGDQRGVRPADGGGRQRRRCRKCEAEHERQHKCRRLPREPMQMFQRWVPPVLCPVQAQFSSVYHRPCPRARTGLVFSHLAAQKRRADRCGLPSVCIIFSAHGASRGSRRASSISDAIFCRQPSSTGLKAPHAPSHSIFTAVPHGTSGLLQTRVS